MVRSRQWSVARFTGSVLLIVRLPSSKLLGYFPSSAARTRSAFSSPLVLAFALICATQAVAQVGDYEHRPVASVEVVLEGTPADSSAQAEFLSIVRIKTGGEYTA